MAVNYGTSPIVQDGLVFAIDPSNKKSYTSGSVSVNDLLSNTTGSFKGTVGWNEAGRAFEMNGSNTYIEFEQTDILKFTGDFCIGAWYFNQDVSGLSNGGHYDRLWQLGQTYNANSLTVNTRQQSGATGYFQLRNNNSIVVLTTGNHQTQNTWQYLVIQRSGTNLQSYFNGVYDTQDATLGATDISGYGDYPFTYGAESSGDNISEWDGYLSQLHMYNRALSTAEVLQNYNALKGRFE
jgi:hypothetical protein